MQQRKIRISKSYWNLKTKESIAFYVHVPLQQMTKASKTSNRIVRRANFMCGAIEASLLSS